MSLHAATTTGTTAAIAPLVFVLLVVTVGYALRCWIAPFGVCRRCHGTGRRRSRFGLCRRCDNTGRRLRLGRRLANHLRELHRNAR